METVVLTAAAHEQLANLPKVIVLRVQRIKEMPQTLTLAGKRYVLLEQEEYERLLAQAQEWPEPALPGPDANGDYPAVASAKAMIARKIVRGRRALGLTQVELARCAGIRPETLKRIEQGQHSPSLATLEKIDRALKEAGEVEEPDIGPLLPSVQPAPQRKKK
jgi:DNA-binding XRE family transcriptional regulator